MPDPSSVQPCAGCGASLPEDALFCPSCGAAATAGAPEGPKQKDPLIGKVVGERYLLDARLGEGASGVIYRGEHVTLRRPVAVKLLHHKLSRDDLAIERFRREAQTVGEIDNEHVVKVTDFGRAADGRLFFAMELLDGATLARLLAREGRLPIERTVDILTQLGEALMEAHAMGYVHRDLRPGNIFLITRKGRSDFVKLLDFGLSKLMTPEGDARQTSLGMTFGEPRYMSPEQARGEVIDRRSDIYALGIIAYEMLCGTPPFGGKKTLEVLQMQQEIIPTPPSAVRKDIPPWLEAVVLGALAKRAADRYPTVLRMIEALAKGRGRVRTSSEVRDSPFGDTLALPGTEPRIPVPPTQTSVSVSPANPLSPAIPATRALPASEAPAPQSPAAAAARQPSAASLDFDAMRTDISFASLPYGWTRSRTIWASGIGLFVIVGLLVFWPRASKQAVSVTATPTIAPAPALAAPVPVPIATPAVAQAAVAAARPSLHAATAAEAPSPKRAETVKRRPETPRETPSKGAKVAQTARASVSASTVSTGMQSMQSDRPLGASDQADAFVRLGRMYLEHKEQTKAAGAFLRARQYDPRNTDAIAGLGQVAYAQGNYRDATLHFREAVRMAPRRAALHVWLGHSLLGDDHPRDAEQAYRAALAVDPNNPAAKLGLETARGR